MFILHKIKKMMNYLSSSNIFWFSLLSSIYLFKCRCLFKENKINETKKNDDDYLIIDVNHNIVENSDDLIESPCHKCKKSCKSRSPSYDEYCDSVRCRCYSETDEEWGFYV